jgi:hypothetical protein
MIFSLQFVSSRIDRYEPNYVTHSINKFNWNSSNYFKDKLCAVTVRYLCETYSQYLQYLNPAMDPSWITDIFSSLYRVSNKIIEWCQEDSNTAEDSES